VIRVSRGRRLSLILGAGLILGGCTSGLSGAIPSAKSFGPPSHRFAASFPSAPRESIVTSGFNGWPQYGATIRTVWSWTGGSVDVFVYQLGHVPTDRRMNPFLRSFLPTTHGGRIISRFGYRGAIETVPCSTPAGSCPGTIGTLVLLVRSSVYEILENGWSPGESARILSSFRPAD
jgi:hypothetical protein